LADVIKVACHLKREREDENEKRASNALCQRKKGMIVKMNITI